MTVYVKLAPATWHDLAQRLEAAGFQHVSDARHPKLGKIILISIDLGFVLDEQIVKQFKRGEPPRD